MFRRHSLIKKEDKFCLNYVLDNKLGEGMHSQVYKCFRLDDLLKSQPFAVKITREDDEEKKLASKNEFLLT